MIVVDQHNVVKPISTLDPKSAMKKKLTLLCPTLIGALALPLNAAISVPGNFTYTQDFNSLGTASIAFVNDSTIPGWYAQINNGTTANGNAQASDGSAALSGILNLGIVADVDRSLGSKATSTGGFANISYAASFQNTGTKPVRLSSLKYNGELWRSNSGTAGVAETYALFYQVSSTPVTNILSGGSAATAAAGTGFTALGAAAAWASTFNLPAAAQVNPAESIPVNYDAAADGKNIVILPGQYLTIKWTDPNIANTDGHQGIDDVEVTFVELDCAIQPVVNSLIRKPGPDLASPADDLVDLSLTVTGTGTVSATGWKFTAPLTSSLSGQGGAYGTPVTFSNIPYTEFIGGLTLTATDNDVSACAADLPLTAPVVIGTNNLTTAGEPLFSDGAALLNWVVDDNLRESLQNSSAQGDRIVNSQVIDLSTFGYASVTATLDAIAGTSSGFEDADSFTMQVIIDGGTPISILGSTNDLDSSGRLTGAAAGAGAELPDNGVTDSTKTFNFSYIIPDTANTVQIRFIGNSNSPSETYVVKSLQIGPPPPTIFASLAGSPALNNQGTADATDDTFSVGVNVVAVNLGIGNTGWTSTEPPPAGGLYTDANPVTFGPYLLTGGAKTVTLTDTMDPGITATFAVTPPTPALTVSAPANIVRNENGPGLSDDTVSFDVVVTAANAGPGWAATGAVTATGSYGPGIVTLTIPAPLAAPPASVTFTDASYPAATQTVSIAYPARSVVGQVSLGGPIADLFTPIETPPAALWVNDAALRTLTMTAGVAADSLVTSSVVDLSTVGKVYFSAKLTAADTSAGSNYETTDRFKAELLIDGGLVPENVINLIDAFDVGDGTSATAVATSGLNGPKNGYINGYNGTAGLDLVTNTDYATGLLEYNANKARDEFNAKGEDGNIQISNDFALAYEIPEGAGSVQLVIYGAGVAGTEALVVSDVLFSTTPPAPPTADSDGDGVSNADELIMGTLPNDGTDVLRLTQNQANPSQISFPTKAGRFYRVYISDDANEASHLQVWNDSGIASIVGDGNPASFNVDVLPAESRRFYRLHVMQTDGPWPASTP